MLIPSKYENLNKNLLVISAEIISHLKKNSRHIEELYQKMRSDKGINLDQYLDCLTFLWLADIISVESRYIKIAVKGQ